MRKKRTASPAVPFNLMNCFIKGVLHSGAFGSNLNGVPPIDIVHSRSIDLKGSPILFEGRRVIKSLIASSRFFVKFFR